MRIKIRPNNRKPWALRLRQELSEFLRQNGHRIVARGADATICIGGDGTIYYAAFRNAIEGRLIGIGSKTSFVCQLREDNWKGRILPLLRQGSLRLTLQGHWHGTTRRALADFVIHSQDYRVVWVLVEVNGRVHRFEGDGVIVATATGSSGYAYSAGGPRLRPHSSDVLVVPICPYRRTMKPLRLRTFRKPIRIWSDKDTMLILDGRVLGPLPKGKRLVIGKGEPAVFA